MDYSNEQITQKEDFDKLKEEGRRMIIEDFGLIEAGCNCLIIKPIDMALYALRKKEESQCK